MKRNLLICAFLLISSVIIAQTPYFPTQVGRKSLRGCYDSKGALTMYTEEEVTSVKQEGDVITVIVHTVTLNPDKTQFPYILPYDTTYEIRNGDVYFVLAAEGTETSNIGNISIPANMKVGDDLGGGEFKIMASGIANKSTIHYRKVIGEEAITTPAGTFDCMVLEQLSEAKILGMKQSSIMKTWYALNVGDVKTEVYTTKGKLRTRTQLEEFN